MFILLPVSDEEVPARAERRQEIARAIMAEAEKFGYQPEDVLVDGLVMTVSADPTAANETLDFIAWCTCEWKVGTVVGLSNVSFGLPERELVNSAFLTLACGRGLTAAIANPLHEPIRRARLAADALLGRDANLQRFVAAFADAAPAAQSGRADLPPDRALAECVVQGDRDGLPARLDAALAAGFAPRQLLDECLIPAIGRVGELFDQKKYFLPQLMMGADTMKAACDRLEPLLREIGAAPGGPAVVLATVKGDIHDIGKNIVALLLRNFGFQVTDLGKDVPAEKIVAEALRLGAPLIGLSALMTTTMTEMERVIALARRQNYAGKFMIGGAVVDAEYARAIGADGYAADAMQAVRLAKELAG